MAHVQAPPRDWESIFKSWATGPGKSEEERCENAVRGIRAAIAASPALQHRQTEVFVQGSYGNRVNVRRESDVDVGVVCRDTFFFDLPYGMSTSHFGIISPPEYLYERFKNDIGEALVSRFGASAVQRGNKAFDVKDNTYRVDADVAPFFEHRVYLPGGRYHQGVALLTDRGERIVNWPDQHYRNGVAKNDRTQRRYKRVVRILKRLTIEMEASGAVREGRVPGFLIECLSYNVGDDHFGCDSYLATVRAVLAEIYHAGCPGGGGDRWSEASELKMLFGVQQAWILDDARDWAVAAWNYLGFE